MPPAAERPYPPLLSRGRQAGQQGPPKQCHACKNLTPFANFEAEFVSPSIPLLLDRETRPRFFCVYLHESFARTYFIPPRPEQIKSYSTLVVVTKRAACERARRTKGRDRVPLRRQYHLHTPQVPTCTYALPMPPSVGVPWAGLGPCQCGQHMPAGVMQSC